MKIAVYTIALNEEKHVARWHESAKDADLLLIADTGSTDKTKFIAKSLGVSVHEISVVPWRFDVARNASLALIPEDFDICIQLDMDETLQPGWRKIVEDAFLVGINWPSYREVTLRNESGKAISWFNHHRIHPRKGFLWKYPIHEIIQPTPGTAFKREFIELEVDHNQDRTKSRKSYLSLLEMAVKEDPSDWRMQHYLNREYWYNRDWNKVLSSSYEAMELSNGWDVERASTCMWASEASHFLNLKKLSFEWAERATSEAPAFYEAWHWRAHIAHLYSDWESCLKFSSRRLDLQRQDHHLVKPEVWEWWGYDLMALASHKLNLNYDAYKFGELAIKNNSQNTRLENNSRIYRNRLKSEIKCEGSVSIEQKLRSFPKVFYINMEKSVDRRNYLENQFKNLGIKNYSRVEAYVAPSVQNKLEVHKLIYRSHIKAIRDFIQTGADWAIICEDDISFDYCKLWDFKWESKLEQLIGLGIDILQMVLITSTPNLMICDLHLRREGVDWGANAYLISRFGANSILKKNADDHRLIGNVECDLYDGLEVHSEALLSCDLSLGSTFQDDHVEKYHRHSFELERNHLANNV